VLNFNAISIVANFIGSPRYRNSLMKESLKTHDNIANQPLGQ